LSSEHTLNIYRYTGGVNGICLSAQNGMLTCYYGSKNKTQIVNYYHNILLCRNLYRTRNPVNKETGCCQVWFFRQQPIWEQSCDANESLV